MPELHEIDLSKNNTDSVDCFRELADFIIQNKTLKSLSLMKTRTTDLLANYLAEPLVRAQQIETIKLDFNEISGVFLEKYCRKMAMIGFTSAIHGPGAPNGIDRNASSSILGSESEEVLSSRRIEQSISPGLIVLSLEGNDIGDRGAEAIASMIQKESDATRNLKTINLNECGIGNIGF